MSRTAPERWQTLSPHLDHALELSREDRIAYVETLRARDPQLAVELQSLLDAHEAAGSERFLEGSPASSAGLTIGAGQTVGSYTLVCEIGHGGMGSVWLARRMDGRFERNAAIKFLNRDLVGQVGEERFRQEGSLLALLTHPNIAQLMDAGVTPAGQPFLVIEFIDGEPVDQYCDSRKLPIERRLKLFIDVLTAVAHAHVHLVVHRDLKPSNVLVTTDEQVKLLDFGIAKLIDDHEQSRAESMLTRVGGWALTPEYAAPEQVTGNVISTATDVYSLGVMLYVLLCGRHPTGTQFQTPQDIVKAVVDTVPRLMSDALSLPRDPATVEEIASRRGTTPDRLGMRLKGDLDTIVRKAIKKDPAERYRTVAEIADDIRGYLNHQPISARPDSVAYRAAKFVRRNRVAGALAALAFIAVVTGVTGTVYQARTARAERDYALRQLARAEALNDLNQFLLTDAAPSGKPLAVNELLERAEQIVSRQTAGSPESRADLLMAIGRQYGSMDEVDKARRLLESARSLAWTTDEPSIRARTACALAGVLAKGDELDRGKELLHTGMGELPDDERYTLDRAFCLTRGSYIAREAGDTASAIEQATKAQKLLAASPFKSEIQDLSILLDIAESYSQGGQFAEAIPVFERASAVLTSLGREQTQKAGTLYNNWALSLDASGRPLDAEVIFRRAMEVSRADATDDAVSPMLQLNYGRTLGKLGRLDEAARHAEAGYDKGLAAGFEVVVNQALLARSAIYRQRGELERAAAMLDEVEPRMRRVLPPEHYAFGGLLAERALLALAQRDAVAASELIDQAYVIAESARLGGGAADYAARLLIRRAEIRNAAGRHADAAADAREALRRFDALIPSALLTSLRGDAYLALGRAQWSMQENETARFTLLAAQKHLESALGPEHERVRTLREQIGRQ